MFDVTLTLMLFHIIYAGRAALTFNLLTMKQVGSIVWRFAKKMLSFGFKIVL